MPSVTISNQASKTAQRIDLQWSYDRRRLRKVPSRPPYALGASFGGSTSAQYQARRSKIRIKTLVMLDELRSEYIGPQVDGVGAASPSLPTYVRHGARKELE